MASLLFDPITLLGLEPIPEGYSESTENRIVNQYRTKLLSKWIKRNVASDIQKQIAKSTSPLLNAFIYLAGNSVDQEPNWQPRRKESSPCNVDLALGHK